MRRNGAVAGIAFDASGAPLEGTWICAAPKSRKFFGLCWFRGMPRLGPDFERAPRVVTGADGRFEITCLPAGDVVLHTVVNHGPQACDVIVRPGETTRGVELRLPHSGRIEVRVEDPAGDPLPLVDVGISQDPQPPTPAPGITGDSPFARMFTSTVAEESIAFGRTDEEGRAVFSGMPTGAYNVRAVHRRFVAPDAAQVVVAAGAGTAVTLRLRAGATA